MLHNITVHHRSHQMRSTVQQDASELSFLVPVVRSSGGMCVTVPYVPVLTASADNTRDKPKSATFAMNPRLSLLEDTNRMLPPVRSPCRMSRLWRYVMAAAISLAVFLHRHAIQCEWEVCMVADEMLTGWKTHMGRRVVSA